jgi:hypothetical protein
MKLTPYHAKYIAHELTRRCASDSIEKLTAVLSDAQVDLNPHQIKAALFAFRNPLSRDAILTDEVGLGKTRKGIHVLPSLDKFVPANLRKQWSQELADTFFLPSAILEARTFNDFIRAGMVFNGTNTDPKSKEIYQAWLKKHAGTDRVSGSPAADMRAALVDYFRDEAAIMDTATSRRPRPTADPATQPTHDGGRPAGLFRRPKHHCHRNRAGCDSRQQGHPARFGETGRPSPLGLPPLYRPTSGKYTSRWLPPHTTHTQPPPLMGTQPKGTRGRSLCRKLNEQTTRPSWRHPSRTLFEKRRSGCSGI